MQSCPQTMTMTLESWNLRLQMAILIKITVDRGVNCSGDGIVSITLFWGSSDDMGSVDTRIADVNKVKFSRLYTVLKDKSLSFHQSFDRLCVGHVHCVWETDCVVLREIFPLYFPRHVSGLGSRALTPQQVKSWLVDFVIPECKSSFLKIKLSILKSIKCICSPMSSEPQSSHHCITDQWPHGPSCPPPAPGGTQPLHQILQISN